MDENLKELCQGNKDLIVKFEERYGDECLFDKTSFGDCEIPSERKPQGFVEIYEATENEKRLLGKHNLVVYLGREWLAVRATRTPNGNITPTYNEFISWFGVGVGGTLPGDPFDPVSPTNEDTDLDTAVGINATDATCADYHDGYYWKKNLGEITFEQDPENSNSWLLVRIVVTLNSFDANGQQLSEAGLYTSESTNGGFAGPFHMFSRVTFPTIVKNENRQLIFVWYLYF